MGVREALADLLRRAMHGTDEIPVKLPASAADQAGCGPGIRARRRRLSWSRSPASACR